MPSGHISGGHFNPAITLGLLAGGRIKAGDVLPYIVAQVIGAVLAAWLLAIIASGNGSDPVAGGLAVQRIRRALAGRLLAWRAAFITEVLMTFFFLLIILGATDPTRAGRFRAARHRPRAHADPSRQHSRSPTRR